MDIGIGRENNPGEKRVVLLAEDVKNLAKDNKIYVEKSAGEGIGIRDDEYEKAGAKIVSKEKVYACSLVIRLKEPKPEELVLMRPGAAMMSMMHLSAAPDMRSFLEKHKIIAISLEEIKNPLNKRMVEALHQTGYLAMEKGFELWGKDPSKCLVKIMGYGNVAHGAMQCAARKFARVIILHKQDFKNITEHMPGTDILVNALNWPQEKQGKEIIVTREMLKLFKKGSVVLDLISNVKGHSPIETMRPTTLDNIAYEIDDVVHSSCWGWPGLDPLNISRRYSLQVTPIIKEIAQCGLDALPEYIKKATHFPPTT
jgi:alanine dehydrogenase